MYNPGLANSKYFFELIQLVKFHLRNSEDLQHFPQV